MRVLIQIDIWTAKEEGKKRITHVLVSEPTISPHLTLCAPQITLNQLSMVEGLQQMLLLVAVSIVPGANPASY
jgi:hypothetical protein